MRPRIAASIGCFKVIRGGIAGFPKHRSRSYPDARANSSHEPVSWQQVVNNSLKLAPVLAQTNQIQPIVPRELTSCCSVTTMRGAPDLRCPPDRFVSAATSVLD